MSRTIPTKTLVSITMCTYNGEQFLREQLDSLITQDYKNYELIIVDDCSTDTTWSILEKYAKKHTQISLYSNETNLGFKKNFERALTLAKGEFIALCDQDDVWFPNKISTLVREIGPNTLIYSNSLMVDENGEPIFTDFYSYMRISPHRKTSWQSLIFENYILGHNMLFRKELLKYALPFPNVFKEHDHWLAIYAASAGSAAYLPNILSLYRLHSANCTIKKKIRKKKSLTSIIRYITNRKYKLCKTLCEYRLQVERMNHILKIDILNEAEKNELQMIKGAYQNSFCLTGVKKTSLKSLLKQNPQFTCERCDQKRYIKSITRSFLAKIIR